MFQLFGVQRCFDFEFMFFHKLTSLNYLSKIQRSIFTRFESYFTKKCNAWKHLKA